MLNVVFDVQKKLYKLPELWGGGEVIWAMPKRNQFFSCAVFPNRAKKFKRYLCRSDKTYFLCTFQAQASIYVSKYFGKSWSQSVAHSTRKPCWKIGKDFAQNNKYSEIETSMSSPTGEIIYYGGYGSVYPQTKVSDANLEEKCQDV